MNKPNSEDARTILYNGLRGATSTETVQTLALTTIASALIGIWSCLEKQEEDTK